MLIMSTWILRHAVKFRVCQLSNVRLASLLFADDVVLIVLVVDVTQGLDMWFPSRSGTRSAKYPDLLNSDTNESLIIHFISPHSVLLSKAVENIEVAGF